MFRTVLLGTFALLVGTSFALAAPKDDAAAAAKKLADAANYSWKTTTEMGGGGQFRPGPTEGKTEKGGFTLLSITRGENTTEVVIKGDKGAFKTADGWQAADEAAPADANQRNPGRFLARMIQTFKAPAAQALDLAEKAKELKEVEGTLAGDLTEEAVKALMAFGRGGANAPEVKNPKGSVKFWIKDGTLLKLQFRVQGTVTFNDQDRDIDRTTTTEIKDVGSTKIEVPEDAKKKLP